MNHDAHQLVHPDHIGVHHQAGAETLVRPWWGTVVSYQSDPCHLYLDRYCVDSSSNNNKGLDVYKQCTKGLLMVIAIT